MRILLTILLTFCAITAAPDIEVCQTSDHHAVFALHNHACEAVHRLPGRLADFDMPHCHDQLDVLFDDGTLIEQDTSYQHDTVSAPLVLADAHIPLIEPELSASSERNPAHDCDPPLSMHTPVLLS